MVAELCTSRTVGRTVPIAAGSSDAVALARAKRLVAATVHPDTGDIVSPVCLRLSCLVPMNCAADAMMLSARGMPQIIAAQWLNQTYNALHYCANRNATNVDISTQRWLAYTHICDRVLSHSCRRCHQMG